MILGIGLLLSWCLWWTASVCDGKLVHGNRTWIPVLPHLGQDFLAGVDRPCRVWLAGGDPYTQGIMSYPPVVLHLFAWCRFLTPSSALLVWLSALSVMAGLGALASWHTRLELDLWYIPLPFALAVVLCSTPITFAMERGNYDLLVLPLLILGAWLLRGRSVFGDAVAGLLLALAAWIKIYPGVLFVGLLALRRWRALLSFVLTATLVGLVDFRGVCQFLEWGPRLQAFGVPTRYGFVHETVHTLSGCWPLFWRGTGLAWLARIPEPLACASLLLPLIIWVSLYIYKCPNRAPLIYGYFLWLVAVATFLPPIANDYNLLFLPIAAVAVWDRRDAVIVHLLMAPLLLWWQPLRLPIGGVLLFVFKLLGLVAVAASLVNRIREQMPGTASARASAIAIRE